MNKVAGFGGMLCKAARYSVRASRPVFFLSIAAGYLHSLFYIIFTVYTEKFFESLKLIGGEDSFRKILGNLILLLTVVVFRELFNALHNLLGSLMRQYSHKYNMDLLHQKMGQTSAEEMEKKEFLDKISTAKRGAEVCFPFIDNYLDLFDFYLPYFLFMGIYLYRIEPLLPLLILIVFLPFAFNAYLKAKIFRRTEENQVELIRQGEETKKCFLDCNILKELRTYNCIDFIRGKYTQYQKNIHKKRVSSQTKAGLVEIFMKALTLLGYCAVILFLIKNLLEGKMSVGEFAAVYSSQTVLFTMMEYTIYRDLGSSMEKMYLAGKYIEFVENGLSGQESPVNGVKSIEFENVSYGYDLDKMILKDISFRIEGEGIIAIVGENGAGKTTLSRLIIGLLKPVDGTIKVNGAAQDMTKLHGVMSAVFQNYIRYKLPFRDNITISQSEKNNDSDYETSRAVCKDFVEPPDEDTILAREFGGRELSGGQWQRIAIARGMYRDAELIVLDEPTSAIDPMEEYNLFGIMEKACENKLAFIVTHRLACAKLAKQIIVLNEGRIAGCGTHDELLDNNPYYQKMYRMQADWYK